MGWDYAIYAIISIIISYAFSVLNKPKRQTPTAGTLDVPTPDPGALVGVVFGTNIIKNSNIIWYGDASTRDIKSDAGKK
jgi:hypothetical protein